ncbi:MAG: c-type cytochrome [Bdellovibrio sp.]|nr:c-type cytochrome [Bdellovibrio sp.]
MIIKNIVTWLAISLTLTLSFHSYGQDIAKGARYYKENCAICHGQDALGIERKLTPRLAGQKGYYLLDQLNRFKSGKRPAVEMKATYDAMNKQEMKDVAAFLEKMP